MIVETGKRIHVQEVAPRDGFQIEPKFIPTEAKIALINELGKTGLAAIEVTSFTSPKAIPALRDAEDVMRGIARAPGVTYPALVPNLRGAERALTAGVDGMNLVISVSETHNLANLRMTREQSCAQLCEVIRAVAGRTSVNASLSTCFGCPMEGGGARGGGVAVDDTAAGRGGLGHQSRRYDEHGASRAGGPSGGSVPAAVAGRPAHPASAQHARLGAGQRSRRSRRGGGSLRCVPGRAGWVPVRAGRHGQRLHRGPRADAGGHGISDGVDLDRLLACARSLPGLVGHDVPGQVAKAGRIDDLHPAPVWLSEVRAKAPARG